MKSLFLLFCGLMCSFSSSLQAEPLSFKKAYILKDRGYSIWGTQTFLIRGVSSGHQLSYWKISPMTEPATNQIRSLEKNVLYICEIKLHLVVANTTRAAVFDMRNCEVNPDGLTREQESKISKAAIKLEREEGRYINP